MPVEVTKNYIRKRLMPKSVCSPGSHRMRPIKGGKKLVVCCPRGTTSGKANWNRKSGRCRVGTRAQSMLIPRRKR